MLNFKEYISLLSLHPFLCEEFSLQKNCTFLIFWLTVPPEEAADETEDVELMELWLLLRVLRCCWWCCTCLEARFIFILGIKRIQRSSPNATSKQNPILEGIQVCLVRWQSGLKFKKIVQFRGSLYIISLEDKIQYFCPNGKALFSDWKHLIFHTNGISSLLLVEKSSIKF